MVKNKKDSWIVTPLDMK